MRNDRLSMLQQWGMSHDEALRNETRIGFETMNSGETFEGASRFADGAGRHTRVTDADQSQETDSTVGFINEMQQHGHPRLF